MRSRIVDTVLCAAFCGTGKSFICKNSEINAIEIEYWKYKDNGLQHEYVRTIRENIGKYDFIFISTDPDGLKLLNDEGFDITLVYPKNELRNEYLDRYIDRDSPYEFIGTFMKHWNMWIDELKKLEFCKHIVLDAGEYLLNVINKK